MGAMERSDAELHATLATPPTEHARPRVSARPSRWEMFVALARSPMMLVPIVVLALALRLNGLTWDDGCLPYTGGPTATADASCHLHPDERNITNVITTRILPDWPPQWRDLLDPDHSPLNPRSDDAAGHPRDFAYGSLPLFVTKAVAGTMQAATGTSWTNYDHIAYVGRVLSAILDVGTLLLVWALARRYAPWAGTVAAFLLAVCVLHIQLAHFFATDTWVTFFATASVWGFVRAAERGRARDFVLAGVLAGAGVASKASVAFLAFPALAAVLLDAQRGDWRAANDRPQRPVSRALYTGLIAAWSAVIAFAVAEPYALLRSHTYLEAIGTQARLAKGDLDYPYIRQYVGTGLLYHFRNLVLWGMGPALGVLALVGLAWGVVRFMRTRRTVDAVLLAWVVPYLAYTAPQAVKFMRYLQPVYPALIVLGVAMLADAARAGGRDRRGVVRALRPVALAAMAIVAVCSAGWAGAFETIYRQPSSRVTASRWFLSNVPADKVVSTEVWDDGFPQPVARDAGQYGCLKLNPQSTDACTGLDLYPDEGTGETRLRYLATAISQADYLVMSSNRLYGSIPKLPWRYPVTIRFYDLLFAEKLGYTKVYDGVVEPHLGPWTINTRAADESFTVYDHPRVLIYQKTQNLTLDQLRPLFADALAQPATPTRNPPKAVSMLDGPVDKLPVVADRGWGGATAHRGLVAVALYLLLFELFGLIGWPLAARVFRRFPDRGWGMAKLLGWLGCAYVVWLGASSRTFAFTLPWCVAVVAAAITVAAVGAWWNRAMLGAHLRAAWRVMLAGEIVTLAGFALFLLFRLKNPDLWQTYWGGEKPFELAHLNAILRSAHFPPYDPWFSGGYINYYYWGGYLHAFAMKLTGVPPEVAFNVALPITMALVWGAAFSVGSALWVAVRHRRSQGRDDDAVTGGVAAALAVALLGNLNGFGQVAQLLRAGVPLGQIGQRFDFWQSRSIIDGTINEFPFFSGLWADLHAHVIALPFAILALGVALAIALHWEQPRPFGPALPLRALVRGMPWASLLVAAVVGGALYCINTWDFPTAVVIIGLGLLVGLRQAARWPVAVALATAGAVAVAAAGYVLYLPFFRHFKTLYGAVARVTQPSPLGEYLVIFGFFLAVVAFGIAAARPVRGWALMVMQDGWGVGVAALGVLAFVVVLVARWWVLVVTVPLLGLLALLWLRAERQPGRRMLYGYALAGIGLTAVVEIVFLVDDLRGGDYERMNTVFKFHFQAWTLIALASVGFVSLLTDRWQVLLPIFRNAFAALAALGVVASLMYPVFGTQSRLLQRMPPSPLHAGLNGNAWMETGRVPGDQWNNTSSGTPIPFADDLALINWLNANITGTPVIAEASIGPYRGNGSRISSATGFPTIIGWERHEEQQRDRTILPARVADVRTLYTSSEDAPVRDVLSRYRVRYIVVGELEKHIAIAPDKPYATDAGLATLARMAQAGMLRVAWQQHGTILYEVMTGAGSVGG